MLKKILTADQRHQQTLGATVGILVGLFLLLFSIQIFLDIQHITRGAKDENILVLNKIFEKNYGKPLEFSDEEVALIRAQDFFTSVDAFQSNEFKVSLRSEMLGFSTLLFLQSLPVSYLGIDSSGFQWKIGEKVPVVLSSDYLALYNYGFAPSQSLPKFSNKSIRLVDFRLSIYGNGNLQDLEGYVYAFSPNINSILVPQSFMDYANKAFGNTENSKGPTQLVVSTDNPYSIALENFLQQQNIELSRGGLIGAELKTSLFLFSFVFLFLGLMILILSTLVFAMNYQIMIASSWQKIELLFLMGYSFNSLHKTIRNKVFIVFSIAFGLAVALTCTSKYFISIQIQEQGYNLSLFPHFYIWITALLFSILFFSFIQRTIQKSLISYFK